jgi:hypothetical protein
MYITDIEFGSSAAAATFTADTFPTLKYGTGTTCGTGTTVFWQAMIGALQPSYLQSGYANQNPKGQ